MKAQGWKRKIKTTLIEAGTYQDAYDPVIDILADTLARRDEARAYYKHSGSALFVRGSNNSIPVQNPALRMIGELDRDALALMRELGMTPRARDKADKTPEAPGLSNNVLTLVRGKHGVG